MTRRGENLMRRGKKILAFLLMITFLFTQLPMTVLAEGGKIFQISLYLNARKKRGTAFQKITSQELLTILLTSLKKENGRTVALVTLNSGKIIEKLGEIKTGTLVTVLVTETADTVLVQLNGKLAKALAENQKTLEIKTEFSTYRLPLDQIAIDSIIEKFGGNIDLAEIKLNIEISRASEE